MRYTAFSSIRYLLHFCGTFAAPSIVNSRIERLFTLDDLFKLREPFLKITRDRSSRNVHSSADSSSSAATTSSDNDCIKYSDAVKLAASVDSKSSVGLVFPFFETAHDELCPTTPWEQSYITWENFSNVIHRIYNPFGGSYETLHIEWKDYIRIKEIFATMDSFYQGFISKSSVDAFLSEVAKELPQFRYRHGLLHKNLQLKVKV